MTQKKAKSARRASRINSPRHRGSVDYASLEQRLALTSFFVNSTVDDASGAVDGLISLREAVIAANTNAAFGDAPAGDADGDIIRFDASVFGSTLMLTEGQIVVSDDLQIAAGGADITLDADGNSRHFLVTTGERVAFGKLAFVGGSAVQGGAISSVGGGRVLVFGGDFQNNEATGLGGGAIFNDGGGSMFISGDSTFTANVANGASGSGGAILSASGTTAITGGSLLANVANRAGGAVEVITGSFFATGVQFGDNGMGNVAGPAGSAAPGNGGALHVTGGGATVAINGGNIIGNGAAREGGGLWNQAGSDMFVNGGATIVNNVAAGSESHDGGGGIFNNGGNVYVQSATIEANQATGASGSGGGIFSTDGTFLVINSMVADNISARAGGGVEIVNGFLGITGSTVSGNDTGITLTAAPGNGGGVHVTGNATVLIGNTTVSGNQAAREGGGLWNQAGSDMFINSSSMIAGNSALGSAADDGGGGVFNNGGNVYVRNATISSNLASGASGSGGGLFSTAGKVLFTDAIVDSNSAARAGGGIELVDGFFQFNNSTLSNNDAGITFTAAPGNGGGLHVTGASSLIFTGGSVVSGNTAANEGGGLWNQSGSAMFIRGGTSIEGNSTTNSNSVGGGVFNKGYLQSVDSFFEQNNAALQGGGIYFTDTGRGLVSNTEINLNLAGAEGGGVFNEGRIRIENSSFTGNVATTDGGGIFTETIGTTTLSNNTFSGNLPNNNN